MVWLSFANLFFLSGLVRAQMILLNNTQRYHIYNVLIGLAFLVPLTYHLAQIRGSEGAAIALCISAFISGILTSLFFPELRNIGYMQLKAIMLLGVSDLFKKVKISK
jgi:O-antigen/teichoic acid export membrane protein